MAKNIHVVYGSKYLKYLWWRGGGIWAQLPLHTHLYTITGVKKYIMIRFIDPKTSVMIN